MSFMFDFGGVFAFGTPENVAMPGTDRSDLLVAGTAGTVMDGGLGDDLLVMRDAADTALVERGDGDDVLVGFQPGVDKLMFLGMSPKEISAQVTEQGTLFSFGGMGGMGVDHGTILLMGVQALGANDVVIG